jgi:quercetin dioxygenase-like cupin family protein
VEIIRPADIPRFVNGGVTSDQLLFPENSRSERLTITRVTFVPGAKNPRHSHAKSEQIWVALNGVGTLLLAGNATLPFAAGDVVRFEPGDVHGLENSGSADFTYLSVTSPPLNFRAAYAAKWPTVGDGNAA